MTHTDFVRDVVKHYGIVALAKSMVQHEKAYGVDEHQLVEWITDHAKAAHPTLTKEQAFERVFTASDETGLTLRKACAIAKSAPFAGRVLDLTPVAVGPDAWQPTVISGQDAYDAVSDSEAALAELNELGRRLYPNLPANQAFARCFEDPRFADLAARAHKRPGPSKAYLMPHLSQVAPAVKHGEDTAYSELMEMAAELRKADPRLTEAQAFERVYCAPANVELAKRERMESAPR